MALQETKIFSEDERWYKTKFPNYTIRFNSLSAKQAQRLRDGKETKKNLSYINGTKKAIRKRGVALLIRNIVKQAITTKSHYSY